MPSCACSGLQQHFGNQYDFPGKVSSPKFFFFIIVVVVVVVITIVVILAIIAVTVIIVIIVIITVVIIWDRLCKFCSTYNNKS